MDAVGLAAASSVVGAVSERFAVWIFPPSITMVLPPVRLMASTSVAALLIQVEPLLISSASAPVPVFPALPFQVELSMFTDWSAPEEVVMAPERVEPLKPTVSTALVPEIFSRLVLPVTVESFTLTVEPMVFPLRIMALSPSIVDPALEFNV